MTIQTDKIQSENNTLMVKWYKLKYLLSKKLLTDYEIAVLSQEVHNDKLEKLSKRNSYTIDVNTSNVDGDSWKAYSDDELEAMLQYMTVISKRNGWETEDLFTPSVPEYGLLVYGRFIADVTVMNDYLRRRP